MNAPSLSSLDSDPLRLLNALPHPLLTIGPEGEILEVNSAAEMFFDHSRSALRRRTLSALLPVGAPLLDVVAQVQRSGTAVNEYRIEAGTQRTGDGKLADIYATPLPDQPGVVLVMLQERSIAEKMDRQLHHRGAARSISAMGSMLAHEIKNPLAGIRGAAQLLETSVADEDRRLTQLICEETDRIVRLVDRFGAFADDRPPAREIINIHTVLDQVKRAAKAGFAQHINIVEAYDPSLPPVVGDRGQLVQVFLNLVKNAAEAIGPEARDGEIVLSTAYRPGVRIKTGAASKPVSLPLEIGVRDNGQGVPPDILPMLFDPFVTTKANGSGLGLALVAKMIGDHGGIVECEAQLRRTLFRVLMPMHAADDGRNAQQEI
jgi:two-component system, NtrC family, nitrogen regulation sensor histidine kinase GlnL